MSTLPRVISKQILYETDITEQLARKLGNSIDNILVGGPVCLEAPVWHVAFSE